MTSSLCRILSVARSSLYSWNDLGKRHFNPTLKSAIFMNAYLFALAREYGFHFDDAAHDGGGPFTGSLFSDINIKFCKFSMPSSWCPEI